MSPRRRTGKRVLTALLPIFLIVALAVVVLTAWLTYTATRPPRRAYLVTPEKFAQLSDRGLKATEESWSNPDGSRARGWLLRGAEGAPGVVLLHHYGADRSWLLNLGVKMNETTNLTVLIPDARGHGQEPLVDSTGFGAVEGDEVLAALRFLRGLKSAQGGQLVGERVGIYGVEMGAYMALVAAREDRSVRALALDSVPAAPDDVLRSAVKSRSGLDYALPQALARGGARVYFAGEYSNAPACELISNLGDRHVMILSGESAGPLRDSTVRLVGCLSTRDNLVTATELPLTGLSLASASPEQGEAYDRRVIEFFDRTLRNAE